MMSWKSLLRKLAALTLIGFMPAAAPTAGASGVGTFLARFFKSPLGIGVSQSLSTGRESRHYGRFLSVELQRALGVEVDSALPLGEFFRGLTPRQIRRISRVPMAEDLEKALRSLATEVRSVGVRANLLEQEWSSRFKPRVREIGFRYGAPRFVTARTNAGNDLRAYFLAQDTASGSYGFAHGEYEAIRDLSLQIVSKYPVSEYYYVGVGRSPTPLTAFLRELYPGSASGIPFSNPRRAWDWSSPELREALERLFSRFLPSREEIAGRKVLFIDYISSGKGLDLFVRSFERFGRSVRPDVRFEALALHTGAVEPLGLSSRLSSDLRFLALSDYPGLSSRFVISAYDNHAPYGRFSAGLDPVPQAVPLSGFERFSELMRRRMSEDPLLPPQAASGGR